ncbi:MAG: sporulation inhibitor of replication protein SirA [Bacilli bacterium]|nr:sporulation inhibitor of replication protein SirA [Bacilli bacterium]
MRHFYIFNINYDVVDISKINPNELFKTFESIHYINKENIAYKINIYNNITIKFNKEALNNRIYEAFKNNLYYTKFMNTHFYNNYYSKEKSKLIINNSYILLDTTAIKPSFFNFFKKYKNYFVCDFENKDYFFLENVA